jgi:hypothetical protein
LIIALGDQPQASGGHLLYKTAHGVLVNVMPLQDLMQQDAIEESAEGPRCRFHRPRALPYRRGSAGGTSDSSDQLQRSPGFSCSGRCCGKMLSRGNGIGVEELRAHPCSDPIGAPSGKD